MRLREFTNAEEQLGLLRRIIDSTWAAIADQAVEQKELERQERAKSKPKAGKRGAATSSSKRTPPPPQPPRQTGGATTVPTGIHQDRAARSLHPPRQGGGNRRR